MLGHGFWRKYDILVSTTTACSTMTINWVCKELNAESSDSVETMAQRDVGGQNCLEMLFGPNMTSLLP